MSKKVLLFVLLLVLVVYAGYVYSTRIGKEDLSAYPRATETQTVELKNGDTYDLVASYVVKEINGRQYKMMAYNGSIPGPIIKVSEGDQVTIRFSNTTDIPTLLHSHGVRMDNQFDGSQLVQKDINPGETFAYTLKFPDVGVMWYHPHIRDDMQQPMGLYGTFVVKPKDPAYWPKADHEEVLTLGDILIENGKIAPFSPDYITHVLMGRFGNTLLVNGKPEVTLRGEPGEVHRFDLVNVATTRVFNFAVKGAKMKLIGSDAGKYEKEQFVDSVILAPSERAIVDVYFPVKGSYAIEHRTPNKVYSLGVVNISGEQYTGDAGKEFGMLRTATGTPAQEFVLGRSYLSKPVEKVLRITLNTDMNAIMNVMMGNTAPAASQAATDGHTHDMSGMQMGGMMNQQNGTTNGMGNMGAMMGMGTTSAIEWEDGMGAMNEFSTDKNTKWILRDDTTGKENMDVHWIFPRGSYAKIHVINDPNSMHPMQHPLHFHGNRFLVLSVNGVPNDNLVWKDTFLLKSGDVADILLENANPGKWMAHCHIAEHLHSGMMIEYDVE